MRGNLYLLKYSWKFQKRYIIYAFLQEVLSSLMPFATIIVPKFIIDELLGERNIEVIFIYICILVLCNFSITVICSWLKNRCFILKGQLFVDFQEMISTRLATCDYEKLEDPSFLDVKEKAKKFLYADGQGFGEVMDHTFHILGNFISFAGVIFLIARFNIMIILLLIIVVVMNGFVEGKLKKKYTELDIEKAPVERRTNYLISVLEDFSYGKEIRLLNASDWFSQKVRYYLNAAQSFYKRQIDTIMKGKYVAGATNLLQEYIVYLFLAIQVLKGMISVGDFTMYISAITRFSSSLNSLVNSLVEVKQFDGYYDSLKEYLNVNCTMDTGELDVPKPPYTIEFRNVSFRYPGQSGFVLKNINVKLCDTEKYSIVGENGAGKTTFIKLLCRLYDPTEGKIFLNGVDIREYNYDQYLKLFSTVFQDYKLFSFTVRDNITLGKDEQEDRVIEVLRKSGFGDRLDRLDKGIDSFIHKNFETSGFEPSGGEGQKIAMARSLYQDRPIMILDEPAAALDPKAEFFMYKNFDHLVKGKLTLYISHRMSSSRFCDRIFVFSDGGIVESGTHAELMKMKKIYFSLYNMQAQYYQE